MPRDNPIGTPFIELSDVDSSNNYAMQQVHAQMAEHGTTWFAHHQRDGKGQRGKTWKAEAGKNIIMSILIQPPTVLINNQFLLSAVVALSCYEFFNQYAFSDTKIKWPNDLYWKDRKAGGVLIENVVNGNFWKYAVIGIGININQTEFPVELTNPVSLKQITGKTYNVVGLAKELCSLIENRWKQLQSTFGGMLEEYSSHLYKLEEQVTFRIGEVFFIATIKGVNSKGELLVDKGEQKLVPYSSLEWVINSNLDED